VPDPLSEQLRALATTFAAVFDPEWTVPSDTPSGLPGIRISERLTAIANAVAAMEADLAAAVGERDALRRELILTQTALSAKRRWLADTDNSEAAYLQGMVDGARPVGVARDEVAAELDRLTAALEAVKARCEEKLQPFHGDANANMMAAGITAERAAVLAILGAALGEQK
jgi:hypothetical protein